MSSLKTKVFAIKQDRSVLIFFVIAFKPYWPILLLDSNFGRFANSKKRLFYELLQVNRATENLLKILYCKKIVHDALKTIYTSAGYHTYFDKSEQKDFESISFDLKDGNKDVIYLFIYLFKFLMNQVFLQAY